MSTKINEKIVIFSASNSFCSLYKIVLVLSYGSFFSNCGNPSSDSNLNDPKVVQQFYQTRVIDEFVLRGNAAILKCNLPSFIADFVYVEAWIADDGTEILPNNDDFGMMDHDDDYEIFCSHLKLKTERRFP